MYEADDGGKDRLTKEPTESLIIILNTPFVWCSSMSKQDTL